VARHALDIDLDVHPLSPHPTGSAGSPNRDRPARTVTRSPRARRIAACATCSARGKNLPDWRGRHGADLNGFIAHGAKRYPSDVQQSPDIIAAKVVPKNRLLLADAEGPAAANTLWLAGKVGDPKQALL
jgi:hypothetical protein